DLMFTTRLVPSDKHIVQIDSIVTRCLQRKQWIFPCVSVVTLNSPNAAEHDQLVPDGATRLAWLNHLAAIPAPAILALRPTFPFSLVSESQIEEIAAHTSSRVVAALGEVFILDMRGQIARRLH